MTANLTRVKTAIDAVAELDERISLTPLESIIEVLRDDELETQLDRIKDEFDDPDVDVYAAILGALARSGVSRSTNERYFVPVYCPIIVRAGDCLEAHFADLDLSVANYRDEGLGLEVEWFDRLFFPAEGDQAAFERSRREIEAVETGAMGRETLGAPCVDDKTACRDQGLGVVYARGMMRFDKFSLWVSNCIFYGSMRGLAFLDDMTNKLKRAVASCPDGWSDAALVRDPALHGHASKKASNMLVGLALLKSVEAVADENSCAIDDVILEGVKLYVPDSDGRVSAVLRMVLKLSDSRAWNSTRIMLPPGFVVDPCFDWSGKEVLQLLSEESDVWVAGFDDDTKVLP